MMKLLLVFVGGGLGSLARWGLGVTLSDRFPSFPWATLTANFLACLVLGFVMALVMKRGGGSSMALFWMMGFCGGFSTFSTFTAEWFKLMQEGHWLLCLGYIFGSLMVCVLGLFAGFGSGHKWIICHSRVSFLTHFSNWKPSDRFRCNFLIFADLFEQQMD